MSFTNIANSVTDRLTSKSPLLEHHLKPYHVIWTEEAKKVGKALGDNFENLETPSQRLDAAARTYYSQSLQQLKKDIRARFKVEYPGVRLPHHMAKHLKIHWIERQVVPMLTPWDEPPCIRELVIEQRKHYFSGIHDEYRVIAVEYDYAKDCSSHDMDCLDYHCRTWLAELDLSNVGEAQIQGSSLNGSVAPLDPTGVLDGSTVPEHSESVNQSAGVSTLELNPANSSLASSISP